MNIKPNLFRNKILNLSLLIISIILLVLCIIINALTTNATNQVKTKQKEGFSLCPNCVQKTLISSCNTGWGIVHLDTMEIIELESDDGASSGSFNIRSWGNSPVSVLGYGDRKLWNLTLAFQNSGTYARASNAIPFCAECTNYITRDADYELAVVDYRSNIIYPISAANFSYLVEDYYISGIWDAANLNLLIVYVPETGD